VRPAGAASKTVRMYGATVQHRHGDLLDALGNLVPVSPKQPRGRFQRPCFRFQISYALAMASIAAIVAGTSQ
jgi:hypothetical protein